jgi:hypothetical protein
MRVAEGAKPGPEPVVQAPAAKSSAPVAPFEYTLQRQGSDGTWSVLEPTVPLQESDRVRVALQLHQEGMISVDLRTPGGTTRPLWRTQAKPGMRLYVPAQGGLPAGRGEHTLVMAYVSAPAPPAALGFRQGSASAQVENRARRAEAPSRDQPAGAQLAAPAAGPYSVEIPLRFR